MIPVEYYTPLAPLEGGIFKRGILEGGFSGEES